MYVSSRQKDLYEIKMLSSGKVDAIIHGLVTPNNATNELPGAKTEENIDRVNK